jgi:hypothetical protein
VIDADPVAAAVRVVMTTRTVWRRNASDLLGALGEVVGERAVKSKTAHLHHFEDRGARLAALVGKPVGWSAASP